MDDVKLEEIIKLHKEIMLLEDILEGAERQPHLEFVFNKPSGTSITYTILNEDLVYNIIYVIEKELQAKKEEFEKL